MNPFHLVPFILLFVFVHPAAAAECGQPIAAEEVASLSGPITLGGLTDKFGAWCQGHGPVSTYRDTKGNEIWFFWKATSHPAGNDTDRMAQQVLLASIVPADDPGDYQIIWPPEFVGKEIRDILAREYGDK